MVDFTITPDALETIVGGFERLDKESREASAAAIDENTAALETLTEMQKLQRDFQQAQTENHVKQSEVSEGILENLGRINEISSSIPLRVIEPIMGIFNPQFSRDKLKEEIGRRNVELNVVQAENQLKVNEIAAQKQSLDLDIKKRAAMTGIEQSEADAVSQTLGNYLKQIEVGGALKAQMLLEADAAGLQQLEKDGVITKHERVTAESMRADDRINRRLKILSAESAEFAQNEREIANLTTEQLYNKDVQKKYGLAPERVNTLVMQKVAYDQQLESQIAEGSQAKLNRLVALAPAGQKEEWINNAKGGVVDITHNGKSLGSMPLKQVQDSLQVSQDAMIAKAFGRTQTVQYEMESRTAVEAIARTVGVPLGEDENPWDTLIRAAQTESFPAEAVTDARTASQMLAVAMDPNIQSSPQTVIKAQLQAAELMKQVQEKVIAARTVGMPDDVKAIATQHFTNNRGVIPQGAGMKLLTHQLQFGEYTGSPLYDNMMKTVAFAVMDSRAGSALAGAITGKQGDEVTAKLDLNALLQGRIPEEETARTKLRDPAVKAALQAQVLQAVYTDAFSAGAEQVRLPDLAARVRSGDPSLGDENGEWNTPQLLSEVKQLMTEQGRGDKWFEYVAAVREQVDKSARRVLDPTGPGSLSKAAINAAVLDNAPTAVWASRIRYDLDAAATQVRKGPPQSTGLPSRPMDPTNPRGPFSTGAPLP